MAFDNSNRAGYEKYYRLRAERYGWKPAGEPGYSPARTEPVYIHYNYFHFGEGQVALAAQMKAAIGLDNAPVALIGSGFNWTAEGLISAGTVAVVGADTSPYIEAAKGTTEEQDIRDYCARSGINPDTDWVLADPNHPQSQFLDGEWRIRPLDWWQVRGANPRSNNNFTIVTEDGSTNGSRGKIKQELRDATGSQTGDDIHHFITEEVLNSLDDADAANLIDWMQSGSQQNNITPTGGATVWHMLSPLQTDATQNPDLNWKTYNDWRTFLDANGGATHNIICTVPVQGRTLFEVM